MIRPATRRCLKGAFLMTGMIGASLGRTATVTTVHVFQGSSDGGSPQGDIVIGPDGSIYGKTIGSSGIGIFRVNPQTGINSNVFLGSTGANDDANSGATYGMNGALYGASYFNAGSGQCYAGCGLIFQVNGTTGALSTLYQFQNDGDGRGAWGVVSGPAGVLYGFADEGGTNHQGSIFRLDPATGKMTVLHDFTGTTDGGSADGVGVLFAPDGALFGTTVGGGENGHGTLFRLDPFSGHFKILHQFTVADGNTHIFNAPPNLVIGDENKSIYGTTESGGTSGKGMIFHLAPATGVLKVLHSFNGADGSTPTKIVLGKDGKLYGLTVYGGAANFGTVFELNPDTGAFQSLYSFTNQSDGAYPGQGGLAVSADGSLYGTTHSGGGVNRAGSGTVFKVAP